MQRVNVLTKDIDKFAGKWVAIKDDRIIAVGDTLDDISSLVTKKITDKSSDSDLATAFKVPYKDEIYIAPSSISVSHHPIF